MAPTESYPAHSPLAPLARDLLRRKVDELWSVPPSVTVLQAIAEMAAHRIGALLVMEEQKLIGIVSERDCTVRCILAGKPAATTRVADIMTSEVVSVGPNSTLRDCMTEITTRRIRHLPVLDQGQVIGVLSIGDIVRETLDQQRHAIDELERYVAGEPILVAASDG